MKGSFKNKQTKKKSRYRAFYFERTDDSQKHFTKENQYHISHDPWKTRI